MSLKARLIGILLLLLAGALALAVTGWRTGETSLAGFEAIHDDRVVPLRDLKIISDLYAVNIVDAAHKVRNGNMDPASGLEAVVAARDGIKTHWDAYEATRMTTEERQLADEVIRTMTPANAAVAELEGILKQGDPAALDAFVLNRLYQTIDPVTAAVSQLVDIQIKEAGATYQSVHHQVELAELILAGVSAASAVSFIAAFWTIMAGVVRPLAGMTAFMSRLAGGDTAKAVPYANRRDEVGAMAKAVAVFRTNAIERQRLEAEKAENELRQQAERRKAATAMADAFEAKVGSLIDSLSSAATELEAAARSMSHTANETSSQSMNVASAVEQTSANVNAVAAASEELSTTIRDIAGQIGASSEMARRATDEARQTNGTVMGLADASRKIGEVVELIRSVAAQTNLLALNATIEAARAGETGRGFAVVANEVKALAGQTAKATDEIAFQIAAVQSETAAAVEAIGKIAATISDLNGVSASVAAAMEQQGSATQEIARNVQEAAQGATAVSGSIHEVRNGTVTTGAAASQVLSAAAELARGAESLRRDVGDFLAGVRAA